MILSATFNIVVTQSKSGEEVWTGQATELLEVNKPADFVTELESAVLRLEATESQDWYEDQKVHCSADVRVQCYAVLTP